MRIRFPKCHGWRYLPLQLLATNISSLKSKTSESPLSLSLILHLWSICKSSRLYLQNISSILSLFSTMDQAAITPYRVYCSLQDSELWQPLLSCSNGHVPAMLVLWCLLAVVPFSCLVSNPGQLAISTVSVTCLQIKQTVVNFCYCLLFFYFFLWSILSDENTLCMCVCL